MGDILELKGKLLNSEWSDMAEIAQNSSILYNVVCILSFEGRNVWVGGYGSNTWQWVNGQPFTFGTQRHEQTDTAWGISEGCVMMLDGILHDEECDNPSPFICQARCKT